jgi:hypothetical protein
MQPEINPEINRSDRIYTFVDRTQSDSITQRDLGLNLLYQRDLQIQKEQQAQQQEQQVQKQETDLEKYKKLDVETDVESFINILAEKHGLSSRKAAKIIDKINDKKVNPNQPAIIEWIKDIYDRSADFGVQEQRAVFNILQEKNWTELLKDKEKTFNFTNKMMKKWKFSKEELAGSTIGYATKGYKWFEKVNGILNYLPTATLSKVAQFAVKAVAATGLTILKYSNNDNIVNNVALSEMIESFKNKSAKENAFWLRENLESLKENFPDRSFNNQKKFMGNVEKLYISMDFNTKRMLATTDPVTVINLMDEAARKIKFKLFDKTIPEEKFNEFSHSMMSLMLDKMREPEFRKKIISQNVEKDKKDAAEILKIFEFEKRNFVLEGLSQWEATVSSYRRDLEKTRDNLSNVKFALAGNLPAQEYIKTIFEKVNKIDTFFMEIERDDTSEVFEKIRIFESFCHGNGHKPLRRSYQDRFDELNVRELDTLKNHLEYALEGNDKAKQELQKAFNQIYNFNPQSNIDQMKNKWEISLAKVNKEIKEFKENYDRKIMDYVKNGVAVISNRVYKLAYSGSKILDSIKNKEAREMTDLMINCVSLSMKGIGILIEIGTKTVIEKVPNWYIQIENKVKRADKELINKYGLNDESSGGKAIINDIKEANADILKNMLLENIKIVEKHRSENSSNQRQNSNSSSPNKPR